MTELTIARTEPAAPSGHPPVLLLHALALTAERQWTQLGPRLAETRPVLAVDLPGHGDHGPVTSARARPSAIAAALAAAIEREGQPVDVVGYSLGARLAWELPSLTAGVRRLVLGGLAPFEPLAGLDLDAIRATIAGAPAPDPMSELFAGMLTAPGNSPESLLAAIEGLRSEPFDPTARFQTPTLIVIGEDDGMAAGSAALAERLGDARVQRIPGDHPAVPFTPAFGDAVVGFLDAD